MVKKIVLSLIILIFFSCKEKNESKNDVEIGSETQKSDTKSNVNWRTKVVDFQPNEIDLSKNQFLHDKSLTYFLDDGLVPNEDKEYVVNVILLKQYLYHLQQANQGYNLLTMRSDENAKSVIDYYLKLNSISISQEFVNSAVAYNMLKDKSFKDGVINQLKESIKVELTDNNRLSE